MIKKDDLHKARERRLLLIFVLGSLTALGPLSMDMYLPALPHVTDSLHTTASLTQLSITACLLGLGAGQLIFGPWSDLKGRRKPLLINLFFYIVFSFLCGLSSSVWMFIIMRFLQGATGAAGIVIARAAARDMYQGKDLTKFMAMLAIVTGAAPILSPVFGGVILNWMSWQAVFFVLSGIGMLLLLSVSLFLPETLAEEKRLKGDAFVAIKSFGRLFQDRVFIGIAFSQAFISMGMFAYIAASPFVLQIIYGISPQQYAYVFALNGIGIILMAQIAGRIVNIINEAKIMTVATTMSFTGSCLLLSVVFLNLPITWMIIALFMIVSAVGLMNTTSFSLAMTRQGHIAGSASALLGILPFVGGALVSPLTGILGEEEMIPMGIVIFICSFSAFLIFNLAVKKQLN